MSDTPILTALENYSKNPTYQFHIPGHTRGQGVCEKFKNLVGEKALFLDTTDEFDNLGTLTPATGAIKEAQDLAAEAFGARKTFFLINGSTIGNIAIAMSLTKKGQKVIVNRNCHRSVMTGLIASGADPLWVIPQKLNEWGLWGCVNPDDIEKLLKENDDVALVWITNPTYEGVVSNVKKIAEICKKYDVPLAVDEAHGCLWNFNDELPESSLALGADVVVNSLHKTGGSLAQSSMLHVGKNSKINEYFIEKALMLLHTTTPSLMLLASLDASRYHLSSDLGKKQIADAIDNAKFLRKAIDKLPNIHHLKADGEYQTDITKIFIKADNISGKQLEAILEYDFNIEVESASDVGLLILSNIGNSRKDFEYLAHCLETISKTDYSEKNYKTKTLHMPMLIPEIKVNLQEAFYSEKEIINKSECVGRIAGEIVAQCPPGIAILVPGEIITEQHIPYLDECETLEVLK
ncbi:aminotransferase class V-fold PLP-dependent enzyme [bacterium]|nr:aminotransferase class V-fold PLP-dependent enzyme [bacterium]